MKRLLSAVALAALVSGAASAATITASTGPGGGKDYQFKVEDFTNLGRNGYGASVVGDGSHAVVKSPADQNTYGRFDPANPANGTWVDSNDMLKFKFDYKGEATKSFSWAMTDVHDQKKSSFAVTIDGEKLKVGKQANSAVNWFTVLFDKPTDEFTMRFTSGASKTNDGVGFTGGRIAPVPLPASFWLLAASFVAIAAVSYKRRRIGFS